MCISPYGCFSAWGKGEVDPIHSINSRHSTRPFLLRGFCLTRISHTNSFFCITPETVIHDSLRWTVAIVQKMLQEPE